uniref:Methyltransferase FkbM domain-containing protein n=1 Tax=Tetraselmis sp. GSL018 TaxID=582737 RepID=A0A061R0Y0_9CHLO|mmetsp:Transcript_13041/g.30920  ORF Transcript_13041/g.30920 Transcript_13041/m.30920 type:complete len:353 (-) Transcript_13041:207-1265(-)|eukprot:CAMPEP_0177608268 /NCGR_PEP_ID=MMETSP0419_2-20121207/18377_1 /TAXON_ID=582737 /ORGANISM="Tetraselmis sp., Strain GSL018" /LENGTH=352 /DNA_ID=CAMNT_0019102939 /DNA_START=309 /DNA_END=1367 /DNA_ORIENTATION=+
MCLPKSTHLFLLYSCFFCSCWTTELLSLELENSSHESPATSKILRNRTRYRVHYANKRAVSQNKSSSIGTNTLSLVRKKPVCGWIVDLKDKEWKNFSQGGQDGIVNAIFEQIGTTNKFFVEFGLGYVENVTGDVMQDQGLNTYLLAKSGWKGLYFDALQSSQEFNVTKAVLTEDNIVEHFQQASVPFEVDYVSIDVDSIDLWLLKGLIGKGSPYRPRVISIEYNINFAPNMKISMEPTWHAWTNRAVYGASAGAINYVAQRNGYKTVYIMPSGLDLFLIRRDILSDCCGPSFKDMSKDIMPSRMHPECTKEDLDRLVDDPLYLNGKYERAREEANRQVRSLADRYGSKMCDV